LLLTRILQFSIPNRRKSMQSDKFPQAGSLWQRLVRGARRAWQRADWSAFAGPDWQDQAMSMEAAEDFHAKQGRSTCRVLLQGEGRWLGAYLKRSYQPSW